MTTAAQNSKQILAQKGTAATPSFSFLGGNATGMYLAGTNQLGFSTAGVNAVTIDASQNVTVTGSFITPTIAGGTTASSTLTLESTTGAGTSDSILLKTGSQQTRMSIDTSGNVGIATGNLTFSGTGQRITGDMSNATYANRLSFQTSTANSGTSLQVLPNGTAQTALLITYNTSDPTNSGYGAFYVTNFNCQIDSGVTGTGTYVPLLFKTGGSERMRLDTSGNVGIGTSSPGYKLDIYSATSSTFTLQGDSTVAGLFYRASADSSASTLTLRKARGSIASPAAVSSGDTSGSLVYSVYGGTNTRNVAAIRGSVETYTSDTDISGYLWFQTASAGGTTLTERMRIDSSGNVGIGTTSPLSATASRVYLSLKGTGTAAGTGLGVLQFQSNAAGSTLPNMGNIEWDLPDNSGSVSFRCSYISSSVEGSTANNYGSNLVFATKTDGVSGSGTERMRIDSNGNVGIGTSSPGNKLTVAAGGTYQVRVISTAGGTEYYDFGRDPSDGLFAINGAQTTFVGYKWNINGTEKMRIDSSGNVGIGTSSPGNKLVVSGGSIQQYRATGDNSLVVQTGDTSNTYTRYYNTSSILDVGQGNGAAFISASGAQPLTISTNSAERMRIDSSGNVGIGTTSPSSLGKFVVVTAQADTTDLAVFQRVSTATFRIKGATALATVGTQYADNLAFETNATERMRIDTSGNVGIGTSSPIEKLDVRGTALSMNVVAGNGGVKLVSSNNTTNTGYLAFFDSTPTRVGYIGYGDTTNGLTFAADSGSGVPLRFVTNGSEAARIDTSGNLLVGTTTSLAGARISVKASTNVIITQCDNGLSSILTTNTSGTASYNGAVFCNNGTSFSTCGTITVSGSSTAYNTSSDYRLKENVAPMTNGLATVSALKPVTYDWISDKSRGEGFIAHELQAVIPFAVTGEKDAVNEDGSIKPQGVDYSKIVVHLVAACQELSAKNDALEARLAKLEGTK